MWRVGCNDKQRGPSEVREWLGFRHETSSVTHFDWNSLYWLTSFTSVGGWKLDPSFWWRCGFALLWSKAYHVDMEMCSFVWDIHLRLIFPLLVNCLPLESRVRSMSCLFCGLDASVKGLIYVNSSSLGKLFMMCSTG